MLDSIEDCAKRRLIERMDIQTAINILTSQGYDVEEMLGELVRIFYIDLDEFNELVKAA